MKRNMRKTKKIQFSSDYIFERKKIHATNNIFTYNLDSKTRRITFDHDDTKIIISN